MERLTEVTPHIYRIVIPFEDIYTTVFVVKTPSTAVLFDTATYPEDVDNYILPALELLEITEQTLKYIILSHSHRDHAGGLKRLTEKYPDACVVSRNPELPESYEGVTFCLPEDGEQLMPELTVYAVPGHSRDSLALLDNRTETLLTGDSLQLYGIYGSGQWGSNITLPVEHLKAVEKLRMLAVKRIVASHDYHPCGHLAEGAAVEQYLDACAEALYKIKTTVLQNPEQEDMTDLAKKYNADSGLPVVSPRVFNAMRDAIDAGEI